MPNPWKLKQAMCEIGRRMYERGLVAAFEGNLSARLAPDRLLCTPSLMCKGLLKPEDLCVVDMTGKQVAGERKRSSEIYLHLAIYRERPDVAAVVHTHAPHATAFAITHMPIPNCITGEVEVFLGEVPLVPYATPGSPEMGEVVAQVLREWVSGAKTAKPPHGHDHAVGVSSSVLTPPPLGGEGRGEGLEAVTRSRMTPHPDPLPQGERGLTDATGPVVLLLANHGTVSCGKTLEEALDRTEILESYCRMLLLARPLGPVQRLSDQNMRDLLVLKQRLGLPDRRASRETFEDCDLCGNNVFGRGFCEGSGRSDVGVACPESSTDVLTSVAQPRPSQTQDVRPDSVASPADLEAMVRQIADRVVAALSK